MEVLSLQLRQNVFGQLYQENMEKGKPYTITHFVAMRIPRRTIYRIIGVMEVMERTWSNEGVAGSGPPASKLPHAARKRMAKAASNKVGITARKLCRKYGVASSFVTKVLKKEGMKCYKGQKVRRAVPRLCLDQRSAAEQWSEITASPHHKLSWCWGRTSHRMSHRLARSKICGLHLTRPCTVGGWEAKNKE